MSVMTQTPDLARQCAERVCRDVKPFLTDASLTRWNQEWEEAIAKAESLATAHIQSAIDAACAESKWQPMATAPRDGSEVLLAVAIRAGIPNKMVVGHYMPGGHCIEDHPAIDEGWYFYTGTMFRSGEKPVAWMPLPQFPEIKTTQPEAAKAESE